MKMTLKYKLILLYTILVVALISIITFTSSAVFMKIFNSYVENKQEKEMERVVKQVTELYEKEEDVNYDDLYKIGVNALDSGLILMVNNDHDNRVICMSDILKNESEKMLNQMEATLKVAYPHLEGSYQEDHHAIKNDGEEEGYVTLGYYGPVYYTEFDVLFLKAVKGSILKIGIVFLLISSLFIYYFADKLSKPISKVSKVALDIGQGKYNERITLQSSTTEINSLIQSINLLAENLKAEKILKKQMAQNYTHEIRTPITCVLTTIEGMQDGVFEITNERLSSLYSEMLHISKLVQGVDKLIETNNYKSTVNKIEFDLYSVTKTCIDNFSALFENKNIKLAFEYDSESDLNINADVEGIKSVLTNLLSNALKYSDDGDKVEVVLLKNNNEAIIKVKDSGIGIEKEEQNLIFEQLYRVEKSRVKDIDGFGIGLSICKNIVDAHNGEISVKSELGKGSEFIIKIPV
ncbi:MAG: ATP-binding protein [Lachnospirales bacterium]